MDFTYYLQVILSLSVVLLFLFGVLRFSKLWNQKKYSGDILIKDRVPLNANSILVIVSVRGKDFLLGIGGKDISILKEL
tara:strand:+ start:1428 stop:1664 length:237 start_codon:yes stop_codon:yes gene_type:complete